MPQMSPMLWLMIYFYVITTFIFMMILLNYLINLYKLIKPLMKKINKFNFKWFW